MKYGFYSVVLVLLLAGFEISVPLACAMGKKKSEPPVPVSKPLKRAIELTPISDRFIELPDASEPYRKYGQNIYFQLIERLIRTEDYAILVGSENSSLSSASSALEVLDPDPCLIRPSPGIPSSKISIRVNELSFVTGIRGDRMVYGFLNGGENPYNDGSDESRRNDFPWRFGEYDPGWFDNAFLDTGGLHTGLELGHEINFDVILLGATLKYHQYSASLGLEVEFKNRFGVSEKRQLTTRGGGYYYDFLGRLTGASDSFVAGIMLARKTAMLEAFQNAINGAVNTIVAEVGSLPVMARVASRCDGSTYISVGGDYRIPVGLRFYDRTMWLNGRTPVIFTVSNIFEHSSRVQVERPASSEGDGFMIGDELVSLKPGENPPQLPEKVAFASSALVVDDLKSTNQNVTIGDVTIGLPAQIAGWIESYFTRLWNGLKQLVTLPYRIYRYYQYDQPYKGGEMWQVPQSQAESVADRSWAMRQIGLVEGWRRCPVEVRAQGACLGSNRTIVAVIDSGIDYNHRELRRNIYWDGRYSIPGWDFVSGDARPYDDHAHGTEIASLIAGGGAETIGVAPNVTLLPIKAFSPYGMTNSSMIYSAFKFAVEYGAQIIVTAWATPRYSKALEEGVALARAHGVLVVAAAGDAGKDLDQQPYYPAAFQRTYDNVISVGSYSQNLEMMWVDGSWTNYGYRIDLAAPGEQIRVANPRDDYKTRSHTGFSAALVAGAAALAKSHCPSLRPQDLKMAILEGADTISGLKGYVPKNKGLFIPGLIDKTNQLCK